LLVGFLITKFAIFISFKRWKLLKIRHNVFNFIKIFIFYNVCDTMNNAK
jgi:hypothetical protein